MQKMPTDEDESSVEEWAPQHTKYTEESTVFTLADEESICFGEEETLDEICVIDERKEIPCEHPLRKTNPTKLNYLNLSRYRTLPTKPKAAVW